jgi:hypothetical protein
MPVIPFPSASSHALGACGSDLVALRRVLTLGGLMGAFAMGPSVLVVAAPPVAGRCVCTCGLGVNARRLVVSVLPPR